MSKRFTNDRRADAADGHMLAAVCRRSWMRRSLIPARSRMRYQAFLGSTRCPRSPDLGLARSAGNTQHSCLSAAFACRKRKPASSMSRKFESAAAEYFCITEPRFSMVAVRVKRAGSDLGKRPLFEKSITEPSLVRRKPWEETRPVSL